MANYTINGSVTYSNLEVTATSSTRLNKAKG